MDSGSVDRVRRLIDRSTGFDLGVVAIAMGLVAMRILRSAVGFDDVTFSTPAQQITLDAWRDGRMALWSNTIFGGTPHLGNPFTASLYPLQWLAAPFPDLLGPDIELIFHMMVFGLGFYCLGRRLGLARPAPVAMAVAALWSGSMLHRSALIAHLPPLAWMPWAMLCIHVVMTTTKPRRSTAMLAVLVWLILTGGHPQSILMTATLLLTWAAGLAIEQRQWRRTGHLAAAGVLATIAAAPAVIAARNSIAAAADSVRDSSALLPTHLVMPLRGFPRYLLGQPLSGLSVLSENERVTYAGATVVALGIVGAVAAMRARRWSLVGLLLIGGFAASLSLGLRSPTMRFARAFLPGFDQPRVSARWNWMLAMVLIVLAGVGIDRLRARQARAEGLAVAGVAVALALFIAAGADGGGVKNNVLWVLIAALVVGIAVVTHQVARTVAASALAILAIFELSVPINSYIEWSGDVITSTDELVGPAELFLSNRPGLTLAMTNEGYEPYSIMQGMRPNVNSLVDVRSIDGYDGGVAVSRRWHAGLLQIIQTINDLTFRAQVPNPIEEDAMARLGVRYVLWDPARGPVDEALPGWQLRPVEGQLEIYENRQWRGDAIVWYTTERVASPEDAGNRLRSDEGALDEIGLVEDESAVLTCRDECGADGFVTSSDYSGHRELKIVAKHDAVVAIHEQFDEGWTVYVDGHQEQLIAVDGIWSGVAVTAGEHHIELRYEPGWLWPSIWAMVLGWMTIVALLFWPDRKLASGPEHDASDDR